MGNTVQASSHAAFKPNVLTRVPKYRISVYRDHRLKEVARTEPPQLVRIDYVEMVSA